jgi:tripartite ATP-independent transporter DctM subunit
MGGIVVGWFTATEASVVSVVYAAALALLYGELRLVDIPRMLLETAQTTGVVFLVIGTSMAMAWIFAYANVPQAIDEFIRGISRNPYVVLLAINVILLALGTFLDLTPTVLIFTPIFLPILTGLAPGMGITAEEMKYLFGIVIGFNSCIGLVTPPVGPVLFIACSQAKVGLAQINRPLVPMFAAMTAALLLVSFIPALSLWLPKALGMFSQ